MSMIDTKKGRREFLRTTSALSTLGAGSGLALNLAGIGAAAAQSAPGDYRALVCVFLFGGNDQTNTVIPFDGSEFNAYRAARAGIARDAADCLSLGNVAAQSGRSFALPRELQPLASLYAAGKCAILANVGPLIVPTTKTQYQNASVPLPPKLFSHNDQQSVWQASGAEGATVGWGGRIADLLLSMNSTPTFTAVSLAGTAVFLSGRNVIQYQMGTGGPVAISGLTGTLFGSTTAGATLRTLATATRGNLLEDEINRITARSISASSTLTGALAAAPALTTVFPTGSLADQLKMVARTISVRASLGAAREVFFVSQGGYDTHDDQLDDQPALHTTLANAIAAFYNATVELGVANNVTLFTASDFGRTLTSNGDGSDHGWGSHHFVVGGAVRGGTVYGTFPQVALNSADEVGSGRLLPSTAVDQYAATLARWMGVADGALADVVPNIGNFSRRNLGFLG